MGAAGVSSQLPLSNPSLPASLQDDPLTNLNTAFDVAEKYLDIPKMLDAEGKGFPSGLYLFSQRPEVGREKPGLGDLVGRLGSPACQGFHVPWGLKGKVRAGAGQCLGSGLLTDRLQMGLPFVLESGSGCWRGTWVLLL